MSGGSSSFTAYITEEEEEESFFSDFPAKFSGARVAEWSEDLAGIGRRM